MKQICSRCFQGIMTCDCENYNPPVLTGITRHLAERLIKHYESVGWISYEEWPEIHQFIKELNQFTND